MGGCGRLLDSMRVSPEHMAVAGDSAGGNLTVVTLMQLKHEGLPVPRAAVTISPWLDMRATGASFEENKCARKLTE